MKILIDKSAFEAGVVLTGYVSEIKKKKNPKEKEEK